MISALLSRLRLWAGAGEQLSRWVAYRDRAARARELGCGEVVDRLRDGRLAGAGVVPAFEMAYNEALFEDMVRLDPGLGRFDGTLHGRLARDFADMDRQRIAAASVEIVRAHHRGMPARDGGAVGPLGTLRAEMQKRRGHMPIRRLMDRAGPAIQALKPILMMSPLSVRVAALLLRRDEHPHLGSWALPGGFVAIDESLDAAAHGVLATKARIADAYVEQLYTFGAVDRDARTRIVSIAYFALLTPASFAAALKASSGLMLADFVVPWAGETGGVVEARSADGDPLPLAFDHADMLGLAMLRLRGKLDCSDVAFALLPERFTSRALQDVHEAILSVSLNKPAFRRRMLDIDKLEATGERETGASFRPAELFRLRTIQE